MNLPSSNQLMLATILFWRNTNLFFMEQVFSAAHDEDMVSTYELSAYRNSIAELLFRADIVRDSKPKASYIADLGFRTSNKVLSEFHFVDYELSNAE